ncbi:MAG: peptide deformylase [Legionellales bacterium RIFCSPHIGHO2_12_FULL_35_11]|nr:MAG: peptide deformylase [Legionellales bacterium RIFCSPHIGHO2_12_FULL_35_11]
MTIHKIIYLPDPRLRKVSKKITDFDDKLQTLIDDMFETMYYARGVGLAAPQIGLNIQLSVIDVIGDKSQQYVLINPEITEAQGKEEYTEGCLSVPGVSDKVQRAKTVTMQALDRNGKPYELTASGLLGECIQHEIDHLNGKLYIDLLSPLKRNLARKKSTKFIRQNENQ